MKSPDAKDEKPEKQESATKAEQNKCGAAVTQNLKATTANAGKSEQATSEKEDSLNKYRINLYVILTNEEKLGNRAQKDISPALQEFAYPAHEPGDHPDARGGPGPDGGRRGLYVL